jgi:hypothetical protein
MITAKDWASQKKLQEEKSSPEEIRELLALADEMLNDCDIVSKTESLSADHYQRGVYEAALPCAKAVMRASGYRVGKGAEGGHDLLFAFLGLTVDPRDKFGSTLQAARLTRQQTTYNAKGNFDKPEVDKLLKLVHALRAEVEKWIQQNHSDLLGAGTK